MKQIRLAICTLIQLYFVVNVYSQFELLSPPSNGKFNSLIEVDNRVFVGTYNGVLISENKGGNWLKLSSSPSNINVLTKYDSLFIVGTNGSGVYTSSNYGKSWEKSSVEVDEQFIYVYAICESGGNLFAATNHGVMKSINGGKNWIQKNNGIKKGSINCIISQGEKIYAGTNGSGLYETKDKGENWVKHKLDAGCITSMIIKNDYIFIGTLYKGIARVNFKNNKFDYHNNGLGKLITYSVNSIVFNNEAMYIGTSDAGVYKFNEEKSKWEIFMDENYMIHVRSLEIYNNLMYLSSNNQITYIIKLN